jgi:hypothetical protein
MARAKQISESLGEGATYVWRRKYKLSRDVKYKYGIALFLGSFGLIWQPVDPIPKAAFNDGSQMCEYKMCEYKTGSAMVFEPIHAPWPTFGPLALCTDRKLGQP